MKSDSLWWTMVVITIALGLLLALVGCGEAPELYTVTDMSSGERWEHCLDVQIYSTGQIHFETEEGDWFALSGPFMVKEERQP